MALNQDLARPVGRDSSLSIFLSLGKAPLPWGPHGLPEGQRAGGGQRDLLLHFLNCTVSSEPHHPQATVQTRPSGAVQPGLRE